MKTPEMKRDMIMHEQIEQTGDESGMFKAYTLATDFLNVKTLKLSPASETRTFTACKMTHSTQAGSETLETTQKESSATSGIETDENSVTKAERAFIARREISKKRRGESLTASAAKAS